MDLGLEGKTALVLGASQGLGLGVARALLNEGAKVVIAARSTESLQHARNELPADQHERCCVLSADLGAVGAAVTIASEARKHLGMIDILVNNSGGPATGMPSTVSIEEVRASFDAMIAPLLELTLILLPDMRKNGWGRILTITSSGVIQPIPQLPVSNSLRSSLVGFMKTLAGEVAADGVTVNVLAPGRIATNRTRTIDEAAARKANKSVDLVRNQSQSTIPAGRYGTVEEFGAVAAFLASTRASYVTGSIIRVDGGAIRSI